MGKITIDKESIKPKPLEKIPIPEKEFKIKKVDLLKKPDVNLNFGDGLRLSERLANKIFNYLIGNKINPLPKIKIIYLLILIAMIILTIILK